MRFSDRRHAQAVLVSLALGVGACAGYGLGLFQFQGSYPQEQQEQGKHYTYINPLLFCKDQNMSQFTNAVSNEIEHTVGQYIQDKKDAGILEDAALYYKDLNGGPWALIHRSMRSIPASLLKVPLAISVYHHAEENPGFLQKLVTNDGSVKPVQKQYFQPEEQVEAGKSYTIEDLTSYMLRDSDNTALFLLGSQFSEKELADSYTDLGIDAPKEMAPGYTMNVATYASFFRILYNASYLSRTNSEHLLSLLAQSGFSNALQSGVPKGVTVAHKFGEYALDSTHLELHDCGIIYKPKHPYILCVMTHGNNYDKQAAAVKDISAMIYNIIDSNSK